MLNMFSLLEKLQRKVKANSYLINPKAILGGKVRVYEMIIYHYQAQHKSAKVHRMVCEF